MTATKTFKVTDQAGETFEVDPDHISLIVSMPERMAQIHLRGPIVIEPKESMDEILIMLREAANAL